APAAHRPLVPRFHGAPPRTGLGRPHPRRARRIRLGDAHRLEHEPRGAAARRTCHRDARRRAQRAHPGRRPRLGRPAARRRRGSDVPHGARPARARGHDGRDRRGRRRPHHAAAAVAARRALRAGGAPRACRTRGCRRVRIRPHRIRPQRRSLPMSSHDLDTATRPLGRRRWVRVLAIVAAAVVPLAFAGLAMAALSDENGLDRIPAAIVNQDEMVTQTGADGTETPVLAGRLLVTELTGDDSPGMNWQLSNAEEAADKLAAGEVYAVLTIPSDFSSSVVSLSSTDPVQAQLKLETDDAHSYLAGAVAQSLGDGMVRAFGSELTKQYIAGIYTQFGSVGEAFTQAADGATQLADGATQAASGAQQ